MEAALAEHRALAGHKCNKKKSPVRRRAGSR